MLIPGIEVVESLLYERRRTVDSEFCLYWLSMGIRRSGSTRKAGCNAMTLGAPSDNM